MEIILRLGHVGVCEGVLALFLASSSVFVSARVSWFWYLSPASVGVLVNY
jgi:hypothetical protein